MRAGEYFQKRENAWIKFNDPNAMYLNGSGTLLLSGLLSLLPIKYGILLLRITNILAMLAASYVISRKLRILPFPAIFIIVLLIFPFRSAMDYGQYTILFTFLAFLLAQNIISKKSDSLLSVFSIALLVDYKPHIFVGILLLIVLYKRFLLALKALGIWLLFQLFVGLWTHTVPVYEWYLAIKRRSNFVSYGEDNLSLVSHPGSIQFWVAMACSVFAILVLWRQKKFTKTGAAPLVEIFAISLILTPLLHPTDMLLIALLLISQFDFSSTQNLLIGLFLVWSPLLSGAIFTFFFISILFIILSVLDPSIKKYTYLVLVAPYLIYLLCVRLGVNEVSVRHFMQQLILIIVPFRALAANQKLLLQK
jgi:hypothetical protein